MMSLPPSSFFRISALILLVSTLQQSYAEPVRVTDGDRHHDAHGGDRGCQRLCDEKFFSLYRSSPSSSTSSSSYDWLIHTPERLLPSSSSSPISSLAKSKVIDWICWEEYKAVATYTVTELCGIELTNGLLHRRFLLTKKVTRKTHITADSENHDNHDDGTTATTTKLYNGFGTIDFLMTDGGCQCHLFDDVVNETSSTIIPHNNLKSMWRAMEPEATFVLNNTRYTVGDWTTTPRNTSTTANFRAFANRTDLASTLRPISDEIGDGDDDDDDDINEAIYEADSGHQSRRYKKRCHRSKSKTLRYVSHTTTRTETLEPTIPWVPGTRYGLNTSWPPKGIRLSVDFRLLQGDDEKCYYRHRDMNTTTATTKDRTDHGHQRGLTVTLHYELYDDLPVLSKWIDIMYGDEDDEGEVDQDKSNDDKTNAKFSGKDDSNFVVLRNVTTEYLALYPPFGTYEFYHGSLHPYMFYNGAAGSSSRPPPPQLFAFTDQAHGAKCQWVDDYPNSNDTAVDPIHTPFDMGANEPLLQCGYDTSGPGIRLGRSGTQYFRRFESFRTIMLATDSTDPERQSLMKHRMTQTLVPWVTENPLFFHAVIDESPFTRNATHHFQTLVNQMHEVGFEMLIYSFDSSFQLESDNSTYLQYIRGQVEYANQFGIEIGGYDLICLDRGHDAYGGNIGDEYVAIDPQTGRLTGNACFASGWLDKLTGMVQSFLNQTGLTALELDGPYAGGPCASQNHSHHDGLEDSIYVQTQKQNEFMRMLRAQGVYINQPDTYFYEGGNRDGMGYDENQYSLPRWHQLTISRAGIYDDLYRLLPSQSWMFVPLSEYHGGGDAATFIGHPEELEWALAQYLGAGAGACYRGPEIFDAPTVVKMLGDDRTRSIYKRWISFYKSHRAIIIQPVVHLQRPTLYTWDGWMHIDPNGRYNNEIGLAMIFNPTDRFLSHEYVRLPMYYTGATIDEKLDVTLNSKLFSTRVEADNSIVVIIDMPPRSIHTVVIQRDASEACLHNLGMTIEAKID